MAFQVETDIPVPKLRQRTNTKYPWGAMSVGDSFLVPDMCQWDRVRSAASKWGIRQGLRFITRKTSEGIRVWRVE